MPCLLELLRRFWLLLLALFPSFSRERRPSKTVLPVSVKDKTKLVGKPELISYRTHGILGQGCFMRPGLFLWFFKHHRYLIIAFNFR